MSVVFFFFMNINWQSVESQLLTLKGQKNPGPS